MSSSHTMRKKSAVKDFILFQIFEDIANMEKNDCGSKFFTTSEKMTNDVAIEKLMELFGIDLDIDIATEYALIMDKRSKLSSAKRTIIKFITLVRKNGIYDESKLISAEVVDKTDMTNTIDNTISSDHSIPVQ